VITTFAQKPATIAAAAAAAKVVHFAQCLSTCSSS